MMSFFSSIFGLAIQDRTPPPPRPGNVPNAPRLPIDGELWMLIVFGIILGVYFIYRYQLTSNKAS